MSKAYSKKYSGVLMHLLIVTVAAAFLLPLLYALYNSLLPLQYVNKLVSIDKFSLDNYISLYNQYDIVRWYKNTIVMTIIIVVGNVLFDSMAGYALAKLNFPGKKIIFLIVIATMMIPFHLIITPMYIILAKLQWINTMASLTVPFLYSTMYIFLARQFFITIPTEIEDAAMIDGLTKFGIFSRIIVPLSKPVIVTIIIFSFTGTWNSYLVPATFVSSNEMFVLVVGLNTVKDRFFDRVNLSMAGVVLLSLPVILLFFYLQKYFIQGISTTGIKA